MSVTRWSDWEVWLLDHNRVPVARLDDAKGWRLNVGAFGKGSFSFRVHPSSRSAALIHATTTGEQYIYARRKTKEFGGIIERVNKKHDPKADIEVSGRLIAIILSFAICQPPNPPGGSVVATGFIDDAMKDIARVCAVPGLAYNDPGGNPRGLAGLSVAADKSEHPDSQTLERSGALLGDELLRWGVDYDVDYDVYPVWNVNGISWVFETWYQGRGRDLTVSNGQGNVPVILADTYMTVKEGDWYIDSATFKTHAYYQDMSDVVARPDVSTFLRREVIVKSGDEESVRLSLQDTKRVVGYTFKFMESAAYQVGRDFWIYDKITYQNRYLESEVRDDYVAEFTFTIQDDESEEIELLLGDPKPDITTAGGGGGQSRRRRDIEDPSWYDWALEDTGGNVAEPDADNHVHIVEGNFIDVVADGNDINVAAKPHTHTLSGHTDDVGSHTHSLSGTAAGESSHTHSLSGSTGAGASHTHSLSGSTASESSHTHSLSGTSGAGASHTHSLSGSTGNESDHAHSLSGNTSAGSSHAHTLSGSTGAGSSHTHSLSGSTAAGSSHTHSLSGSTGAGSSHTHSLSGSTAAGSSHTHSLSGSTAAGGAHYHSNSFSFVSPDSATGSTAPSMSGATAAGGVHYHAVNAYCATTTGGPGDHQHTYEHAGTTVDSSSHTHDAGTLAASSHTHTYKKLDSITVDSDPGHVHATGTLAAANESSHTHGVGTLAAANESSHSHAVGTLAAASESSHTHSLSGSTGAEASHTHGLSGSTGNESSHTHSLSGSTGAAGSHSHAVGTLAAASEASHTHSFSATSGAGSSHSHAVGTLAAASESSHTHSLSGSTGAGASHTHSLSFTMGSAGGHYHLPGTLALSAPVAP